jgi:hypothetical protein
MSEDLTPQQLVIWTVNAKLREQILMLRILEVYGTGEFTATLHAIADATHMKRSVVAKAIKGLKDLNWLDSERNYEDNGTNLHVVRNCKYRVTIGEEKEGNPNPESPF